MYQNVEFPYSWNLFILTLEGLSLWIPFYCRYFYDWYLYHLFTTFVTCLQPLVNTQSIITLYGLYHWWPLPMFTCQYSLARPLFHRAINCFVYTCMWLICSLDVVVGAVLPLKRKLPAKSKTPAVQNYSMFTSVFEELRWEDDKAMEFVTLLLVDIFCTVF